MPERASTHILMLLGTRTMNCDRSFAHGLRTACPRTALALPGFRRPAVRRRRPSVMLERFREKLVTLGNLAKLRSSGKKSTALQNHVADVL